MAAKAKLRVSLWLAAALLLVFLGFQLVRPELNNPPVGAELQAPPEMKQILRIRVIAVTPMRRSYGGSTKLYPHIGL